MSEYPIQPAEDCLHFQAIRLTGDPMDAQCEAVFKGSRCSRIKCFPEARARGEREEVRRSARAPAEGAARNRR